MKRRIESVTLGPEDLTFLYPAEIISRLEGLARACGITQGDRGSQLPEARRLPALERIQAALLSNKEPVRQSYARLPIEIREHLKGLICNALEQARSLQHTQPDTPLGFLKGPKGVLANLLHASWIDLTLGGKLDVKFEALQDDQS